MSKYVTAGNPFITSDRPCYYVKITLTNPDTGKKRHLKRSTEVKVDEPNALSKAHQARLLILADYQTNHDPSAPLKLRDFAKAYELEREGEHLKQSTLDGIRRAFEGLLRSAGKNRLLKEITASDVRQFLFKETNSPSVAIAHYRYLHAAFDRAVRDEKLPMNPFDQIDKTVLRKRFRPRPRGILTAKDVVAIYDRLPKEKFCDATFANYFLLLFGTGFRRGEGCHLEMKNVDFKDKLIAVRSTEEHRLKTEASADDIPMTEHAVIALQRQIKLKEKHEKDEVRASNYVFCNFRGEHYHPDSLTKQVLIRVRKACKDLKIDVAGVDLHSLRHSLIQHLIDSGAEPVVVSKFARHANLSTTLGAYHKMKDTKTTYESVLKVTKAMPKPRDRT